MLSRSIGIRRCSPLALQARFVRGGAQPAPSLASVPVESEQSTPNAGEDQEQTPSGPKWTISKKGMVQTQRLTVFSQKLLHCLHELFMKATPYRAKMLITPTEKLRDFFWSRHFPANPSNIKQKGDLLKKRAVDHLIQQLGRAPDFEKMTDKERQDFNVEADRLVTQRLKSEFPEWQPHTIDTKFKAALMYHARFCDNYAVLARIFEEISLRDPDFVPKEILDFNSGTAVAFWAADQFFNLPDDFGFHCIYPSNFMLDMTKLCLQGGQEGNEMVDGRNFFMKRFLPGPGQGGFGIVVSSFGLLEESSYELRLELLDNLWSRTSDYLVLIEIGNKHGFRAITEARNYLLYGTGSLRKVKNIQKSFEDRHVFAPCPHEKLCPKVKQKEVCSFDAKYNLLDTFRGGKPPPDPQVFPFSYLVIKKTPRPVDPQPLSRVLRRNVHKTADPKKKPSLEFCTFDGRNSRIVFSKKNHSGSKVSLVKNCRDNDLVCFFDENKCDK